MSINKPNLRGGKGGALKGALAYGVYFATAGLVRLFYRKPEIVGAENLPDGPCIVVGNHSQMNGPIVAELYLPGPRAIWCAGEMMHLKEVPAYAYRDFWSKKPKAVRWFYRLLSYAIAPLSVCVFNNARCIGVYHDMRTATTLRQTLAALREGKRIVIFPEHDVPHNDIVCDFQDRFIDLARMYRHQNGVAPAFVPMYVAPALRRTFLGRPILWNPDAPADGERLRVKNALMDAITDLALAQPAHRVVPYLNVPKKLYPMSRPDRGGAK